MSLTITPTIGSPISFLTSVENKYERTNNFSSFSSLKTSPLL
ncbi:MAG: hypothetical protein ACP5OZ_04885 [Candidatus Woesearchaeota archaeon]